jgi:hypothetical protein
VVSGDVDVEPIAALRDEQPDVYEKLMATSVELSGSAPFPPSKQLTSTSAAPCRKLRTRLT